MRIFRNDTLGSWTRGGQAIVHNVRMTPQIFFQTTLAGLVIWIGGMVWYVLEKSTDYQRFVAVKIAEATLKSDVPGGAPLLFRTPSGRQYWTTSDALLGSRVARKTMQAMEQHLVYGAALAGAFALLMLAWAWFYFTRTGKGLGSNQFLRGAMYGLKVCYVAAGVDDYDWHVFGTDLRKVKWDSHSFDPKRHRFKPLN
mgnify:CR=1 FL=1